MKYLLLLLLGVFPFAVKGQIITTIIGDGTQGYSGDGGTATNAKLNTPNNIKFDYVGNIYIADQLNNVIRKVNSSGIINTVVGNGYGAGILGVGGYSGDGGQATAAELNQPADIVFDSGGNMYISDNGNAVIRKINTAGIITTIAGGGVSGLGDGGVATAAQLNDPFGLVFDNIGNLYFSDRGNHRVRKINTLGVISTIAGTGAAGNTGDGFAATNAQISSPSWLAISPSGELYIPDWESHVIRKINSAGIITTVAGNGTATDTGDGLAATTAGIHACDAIIFDNLGNYYISNVVSCLIRKVNAAGIISTVIGTDTCGYSGDGEQATSAQISSYAVCSASDTYGNLYIADSYNNRIRMVTYHPLAVNYVNKPEDNVTVYPSPATNEVTIKSTTEIESVAVVNMMGQVVVTSPSFDKGSGQANSPKERELNIQALPNGIYFVKVNGVYAGKFVKE